MNHEEPRQAGPPADGRGHFLPQRIRGPVIAGVVPDESLDVVRRAAEVAHSLDVKLIGAYVDISTYLEDDADYDVPLGAVVSGGFVDDAEGAAAGIRERRGHLLDNSGIRWTFLVLSGGPTRALGQLADSVSASIIVVGTREPDLGARLKHLVVGSVRRPARRRISRTVADHDGPTTPKTRCGGDRRFARPTAGLRKHCARGGTRTVFQP